MKLMRERWKVTKDWHAWFAWYPVFLANGKFVCFKKVMRRETWHSRYPVGPGGFFCNSYKMAGEEDENK